MLDKRSRQRTDPIWRLVFEKALSEALEKKASDWLDLQIQLETNDGPLMKILFQARKEATEALVDLAHIDPENSKAIRTLQNQIAIFESLVNLAREVMASGQEADDVLRQPQNQDMHLFVDDQGRFSPPEDFEATEDTSDA